MHTHNTEDDGKFLGLKLFFLTSTLAMPSEIWTFRSETPSVTWNKQWKIDHEWLFYRTPKAGMSSTRYENMRMEFWWWNFHSLFHQTEDTEIHFKVQRIWSQICSWLRPLICKTPLVLKYACFSLTGAPEVILRRFWKRRTGSTPIN